MILQMPDHMKIFSILPGQLEMLVMKPDALRKSFYAVLQLNYILFCVYFRMDLLYYYYRVNKK